jgi:hypothetical protein
MTDAGRRNFDQLFSPARKIERILNDLRKVGKDKPLGYLPLSTIQEECRTDPDALESELRDKGIKTLRIPFNVDDEAPALFAYDEAALTQHLNRNKQILESAGWPTEPEKFIDHLKVFAPHRSELFDVIADAFADADNPYRLHKPKPG